jgi:hypothetical protein
MVRHKRYDYWQRVRFQDQILPGTFEHTLNKLLNLADSHEASGTNAERIQSLRRHPSLGQGLLLLLSIPAESHAPF